MNVSKEAREAAANFTADIGVRTRRERTDILEGRADDDCFVQAFAKFEAEITQRVRDEALEEAAKVADKRRDDRFAEHGTTEPDTNASYYSGRHGETLEVLDEEGEFIAAAIRQMIGGGA